MWLCICRAPHLQNSAGFHNSSKYISFCLLRCFIFPWNFAGVLKCLDIVILLCMSFCLFWIFHTFLSFLCFLNFPHFVVFFSQKTLQASPDVATLRWMFLSLFCIICIVCIFCLFLISLNRRLCRQACKNALTWLFCNLAVYVCLSLLYFL